MLRRFRIRIGNVFARNARQKGSFYRKSLIWLLLTASIPGFIIGGCIYLFSVDRIERDMSLLHRNQIEERVKNIDDQLDYLEMDLSHWAFRPRFGWDLRDLDFVYYFKDTWDISTSLVVLEGSHPFIQDVELYIDRNEPVLFRTDYYKLENDLEIARYREFLKDKRIVYWMDDPIRLVHKIPGDSTTPFGVLVVTMDRSKIVNLLRTMTPYNEGATFLMQENGNVVAADNHDNLPIDALRKQVRGRNIRPGTFLWEWGDKTYSVSYGNLQRIDKEWTYVSASPMTAITSPVVALSNIILIVSTAGLLLALVLSWLASIRMYSPVARLIRRFNADTDGSRRLLDEFQFIETKWIETSSERLNLQARLKDQLPGLREGFLLQLLQGHLYHYSENDLRERMQRYGWDIDGRQFHVLHFQLTGSMSDRFPPGNEGLVTFAASNIIEELAVEQFEQIGVMNFQDLSIGLLTMSPEDADAKVRLKLLGQDITDEINRILNLQVTITIGRPTDKVKRITETFMEVERAAGYRRFENRNQLLDLEELPIGADFDETSYPFALEMEIVQAMRSGKLAEAESLVVSFLDELLSRQGTEIQVQQSMLQLLGSIQHMILQSGVSTFRLFDGANMFEQLSQIREPGKMQRFLKERVIVPYMLERDSRADMELKRIVEQTVEYMHDHYMSISLESCADRAGTNSYTLSKLFKHVTGVNFIDYLTELRISKAKQLLLATDKKINDIAEEVGYQQRYFNRIFKRQVGVTPSQFRELT